jgi:cell division transport system permease protein
VKAWLRQHREAVRGALTKFARTAGLLSALVIGVALALPAGGYVLLEGLLDVTARMALDPQVSVFMKPGAKRADTEAVGAALRADERVAGVSFIPREEALKDINNVQGMAELVSALGRNPLPDAFVVRVNGGAIEAVAAKARNLEAVGHVQADTAWAQRLAAFAGVGRLAIWLLTAVLAVGLISVTFNTIGLQVLTQREEIEVLRLIGATDAFIRRPFYYLGLLQGLAGGALALLIVAAGLGLLNVQVRALATAYGSNFDFTYLTPGDALAIGGFAGLIGWLGAYLSVRRRLREMEPTR